MKSILIFLLLSVIKCSAQSGETGPLPIAPPTYDTIPCHLIYRTKAGQVGIVKGWEVVQQGEKYQECKIIGCAVYHGSIFDRMAEKYITKHITYLLSNRRRFPKGTEVWKLEEPIKQ